MKVTISDFILAFFDLVEAEVRALKEGSEEFLENEYKKFQKTIFKSSLSVLGSVVVGILFFIAILSFAFGLFLLLNKFLNIIISFFIVSLIFFIIGFILLYYLKKKYD